MPGDRKYNHRFFNCKLNSEFIFMPVLSTPIKKGICGSQGEPGRQKLQTYKSATVNPQVSELLNFLKIKKELAHR